MSTEQEEIKVKPSKMKIPPIMISKEVWKKVRVRCIEDGFDKGGKELDVNKVIESLLKMWADRLINLDV